MITGKNCVQNKDYDDDDGSPTLPCTWQQPPSPVQSIKSRAAVSDPSSPFSFCDNPLTCASGFLGEPPREFAADSFSLSLPAGNSFDVITTLWT